MLENVIAVVFDVESEAYQAITELKNAAVTPDYVVSQAALVKRESGAVSVRDSFDIGVETRDDTYAGGLIGMLTGILGGPIGMILCGSMGSLIGSAFDAGEAVQNASIIEKVAQNIGEGQTALLLMAQETSENSIESRLSKFAVTVTRYDAAEVQAEIDEAVKLQTEMKKEAQKRLRQEKSDEIKAKMQKFSDDMKNRFDELKSKLGGNVK